MDVFDAMAINGRWVRLRLTKDMGGGVKIGFVGAVTISGEGSPVYSHISFEEKLSSFSPCGAGSELFLSDIERVEKVYNDSPVVTPFPSFRGVGRLA